MQVIVTINVPASYNQEKVGKGCVKKVVLSDNVIMYQAYRGVDDRPYWVNSPKTWKTMKPNEKLAAFIDTFNEGHGVSFECVE